MRHRNRKIKVKESWNEIYKNNIEIKPTQSFGYYSSLFKTYYLHPRRLTKRRISINLFNGAIKNDRMILPLVVDRKKQTLQGIANYKRLDYEDVISSANDLQFIKNGIGSILSQYRGYKISFSNINEDSLLYSVLNKLLIPEEPCVKILLPKSYNCYYTSLSKHQRQNIRTAYNKINSENLVLRTFSKRDTRIPKTIWNECERIYEQRHNLGGTKFQVWENRQRNAYHHIFQKVDESVINILYYKGKIIAYMAGLYRDCQKCYYIPRLCINNDYANLSPGIILLNEVIKEMINKKQEILDLMLGDEPYKLAMGGVVTMNYKLDSTVDKVLEECIRP